MLTNNMISPEELAFAMNKYFAGNYDISGNGSIGAEDHPTGAGDVGNVIGGADTTRTSTISSLNMTLLAKLCVSRRRVTIRFT